ncbi:hypothetical protein E2C01_014198 [Portunus trituberculatus]|uniref:Uncharacterized protein n=1 Tax=Portunus trituberculatus TaxID=210409 RepID=A0A5B7DI57_PORTR|nr:hypothetical protein [Portunus trituberculatus]
MPRDWCGTGHYDLEKDLFYSSYQTTLRPRDAARLPQRGERMAQAGIDAGRRHAGLTNVLPNCRCLRRHNASSATNTSKRPSNKCAPCRPLIPGKTRR